MGTDTTPAPVADTSTDDDAPTPVEVSLEVGADPPTPIKGNHYAPSEVAGFLGLKSTQTVYRWVKEGKIVPAVQAGERLIAFSREQVDELRILRSQSRGGGRGGSKDATPNDFSQAFGSWRLNSGHSREVVADSLTDENGKGMSAAQIGRWVNGFSLPTAEAMERLVTQAPDLAIPYIKAKAEAAREAKVARAAKKAEADGADEAPTPEQAAAAVA